MINDSIDTHELVTLPIHAVNYSRISLPGTSIMDRSALGMNMGHWFYLINMLNYQPKNIKTAFSQIDKQTLYNYNVPRLFDGNTAIYYKADADQQKKTHGNNIWIL